MLTTLINWNSTVLTSSLYMKRILWRAEAGDISKDKLRKA